MAWCELRKDFRSFRVDRIANCRVLERTFEQRRGQRLSDYLRKVQKDIDAYREQFTTEQIDEISPAGNRRRAP